MSSPSLASKAGQLAKRGGSRLVKLVVPVVIVVAVMVAYGVAVSAIKAKKEAKFLTMPLVEDVIAALSAAVLVVAVAKAGADMDFRNASYPLMLVSYTALFLAVNVSTRYATGRMQEALKMMSLPKEAKKIVESNAGAADAKTKQELLDAGIEAPKEPLVGLADGTSTAGEDAAVAASAK
jgi:hypothetical protein